MIISAISLLIHEGTNRSYFGMTPDAVYAKRYLHRVASARRILRFNGKAIAKLSNCAVDAVHVPAVVVFTTHDPYAGRVGFFEVIYDS